MKCYFFGTFNPIHLGHIKIAEKVKEKAGFEKVVFVPSFIPPHKSEGLLDYSHRLKMISLAVGSDNVSNIESELPSPSYTYRTIEKLYQQNNNQKINFIIGYDQFFKLDSWMEPDKLKKMLSFVVIPRRSEDIQKVNSKEFENYKNAGYDFRVLDIGFLDVSSSEIRDNVKNKKDISMLTTREVKEYIENNRLYL